jgi:hypothetical protein
MYITKMPTPALIVQSAPPQPEFDAASIQVPATTATPQAAMESVKAGQSQLNSVNNFSGGSKHSHNRSRSRRHLRTSKRKQDWKPKSFIRTYKGRKYQPMEQKGGSSSEQSGGQIPIPQVGPLCSGGPQCAGAQNAEFTSIKNQALSNGANDAYIAQTGGRRKGRAVLFSKRNTYYGNSPISKIHRSRRSHKPRHDQSVTSIIAYNIKKIMRKVFS